MARIHLFEFEDLNRFPNFLRNYETDLLQFLSNKTKMWDGMVSSQRTYSVKEMEDPVNSLDNYESFKWEIKRVKSGPGVVLYLLGMKK